MSRPLSGSAGVLVAQIETIRVNVLGMLNLADICYQKQIHLTTYATGTLSCDRPTPAAPADVLTTEKQCCKLLHAVCSLRT